MADGPQHEASLEAGATSKIFPETESRGASLLRDKPRWAFQNAEEELRAVHPHGHPSFISKVLKDIELHSKKNHDYAAGGSPLGNFERVAAILSRYPNFPITTSAGIAMVYMLKQLDAVLWNMCQGHKLNVEGLEERLSDITVYSVILRCMLDARDGNGTS